MFRKILIANRGEIAVRIIRACREMGIKTVAVYSEADKNSLHVQLADEARCIGPAPSTESYLSTAALLTAARKTRAQAIHPGYGFLSENADFAEACRNAKLVFIGPSPQAIRDMGNKAVARKTMHAAGVPIPPGTIEPVSSKKSALIAAKKVGFPVLLKPSAGGGGKGMRIVKAQKELSAALDASQTEAQAAFGCADVYIEKVITNARHIEMQVLADNHGNVIHLGERECSVQRRHQKLVEEAPSPAITKTMRKKMGDVAVAAARAINYSGAGTVEFMLDKNGKFYFIEMNTRIQVEHPVTECITGVDLVKAQIRVASGEPLGIEQKDVVFNGHAIECRLNAEDPDNDFMASPGVIRGLRLPGGPGVRLDTHIFEGYEVPHYYDSLLAKLIVQAPTRDEAIARMRRALDEFTIESLQTTAPFLQKVMQAKAFRSGRYDTGLIEHMKHSEVTEKLLDWAHKLTEKLRHFDRR